MKKILGVLLGAALVIVLLTPSAQAWRSVRTGQKNFERAWSAFLFKRSDKATEYFGKAADAFGLALAENPPSRTTMFPSNLTMAGISAYYAGRYDQAINALDKAIYKDDTIWEAFLYTALSHARQGDKAKTVEYLERYLKSNPSQPILSNVVQKQLTDLQTDSGPLDGVAPALEEAAFRQFDNNVTFKGRNTSNDAGQCNGTFWWRNSKAPCSQGRIISN